MNKFALILAVLLTACGGGSNDSPPPTEHFILIMETTAHTPEFIYVYDTEKDCTLGGSYRLTAFPTKYIGYACKEV